MKKFALVLIVCLTSYVCQAQQHLRFMDVSLGGNLDEFVEKMKVKGFFLSENQNYEDPNFKMDARVLVCPKFEVFDSCYVVARKIDGVVGVSSVIAIVDTLSYPNGEFEKLISLYDKKYGEHTGYWGSDKWEVGGGHILAGIDGDCYVIAYIDKPEIEIREEFTSKKMKEATDSLANYLLEIRKDEQTVREICGVPFGSSYEKTKEMLENKYGYPEYNPDRTVITYKHKTYAGFTFDSIHFLFQSDGIHSYLNGCVFIMDAKSLSDAKKKQEMLYKKLSDKYVMIDDTDSNGNKVYLGGYPPTPDDAIGFTIEILKYDSELARLYSPYAARLAYGRYNYVKEEF